MSDCSQPSSVSGRSRPTEVFVGLRVGGQAALQFAQVAAEGGQQRVPDVAVAGVVAAGDRAVHAGERLPQVVAGVRQPQVEVVVGGQGVEQFDLGGWAAGCGRTATAAPAGRSVTPAARASVLACRMWGGSASTRSSSARHRGGCQSRSASMSPATSRLPVDEQLRPLAGVGREQPGEPARDGVAAALAQLLLLARFEVAEMGGQRACTTARRGCSR